MEAKLYGQKAGGMNINGIIEDYYVYAGENISAGDLVEYINGVASQTMTQTIETSADTVLDSATYTANRSSAVVLPNGNVFLAHVEGATGSNGTGHLHAMILTIDGATITVGTDIVLSSDYNTGNVIKAVLLPSGDVFLAHSYEATTTGYHELAGLVCRIDGTTIKRYTDTYLTHSAWSVNAALLSDGNVFVTYRQSTTSNRLYGIVVTISDTTVTAGTETQLSSTQDTGQCSTPVLLENGNVFIAHSSNGNKYLYAMICTISGTTITAGTDVELSGTKYAGECISTERLPNGKVFVAHSYNSDRYLYGIVCTVSGTTIAKGTDIALNSTNTYAGNVISTATLSNGNIFISHSYSSSSYLYGMIVKVSGTTITAGSDTSLVESSYAANASCTLCSVLLKDGNVFIAHCYSSSYKLYGQVWDVDETNNIPTNQVKVTRVTTDYETQVRKVTTPTFDGIAKTSGAGGTSTAHKDKVSIYTLAKAQEFAMADGNTLHDANGNVFMVKEAS